MRYLVPVANMCKTCASIVHNCVVVCVQGNVLAGKYMNLCITAIQKDHRQRAALYVLQDIITTYPDTVSSAVRAGGHKLFCMLPGGHMSHAILSQNQTCARLPPPWS
jgi:hypothetical protein